MRHMYASIAVSKNNEAKPALSSYNRSIYVCKINFEKGGEEENVDAVVATRKRPTWDASFVKRA